MTDWPTDMPVVQVRVARPTGDLDAIIRFYGGGLGLQRIGSFHGHAGYDGVMFGLPGRDYHLEFTAEAAGAGSRVSGIGTEAAGVAGRGQGAGAEVSTDGSEAAAGDEVSTTCGSGWVSDKARFAPPSQDNLLVLYLPDSAAIDRIAARLASMGYPAVAPENPYWAERGVTIEDPDGWRVVLMNTAGI